MMNTNKCKYIYAVQGNYGSGFEDVTYDGTKVEADRSLKDYNDNEPGIPHRVVRRVDS